MTDDMQGFPASAINVSELNAHMAAVSRWMKLAGTETELESLAYFQERLEAYGYATRQISHDAYISLPGPAGLYVDGREIDCITHSFSRKATSPGLAAEVIYLGNGGEAAFSCADVRGKIVLIESIATPEISHRASMAGAAGQTHVSPNELRYEMCISPVWGNPSVSTVAGLPSTVVISVSQSEGQALISRSKEGRTFSATLRAEVDTGWRKTPILVADMDAPSRTANAPFVMLSGHHDTWYFGVMDNGGANATMLEVARLCASKRDNWERGLRICFWSGHSQGRYSGSAWYADNHWEELEKRCVAHVNVDSTGGKEADILGTTASMSLLRDLAAEAVTVVTGQTYVGKRRGRSGDDSFCGIGIPSMFGPISEHDVAKSNGRRNLGWWWHTPEDLLDKIDMDNLVRDTRVVLHAVWRLVSERVLPLNFSAQLDDLEREVKTASERLKDRLHLEEISKRTGQIDIKFKQVLQASDKNTAALERVNATMVRLSRVLVPLDYTYGDRFAHEPAVPVPAWPSLQPIRDLAACDLGPAEMHFLHVDAIRQLNRIVHSLGQAEALLDDLAS